MRQVCGAKRDAVLLQGLAGGGTVDFSVTSSLLLACAGEEGHPDSKTMGAIGRCVRLFNAPLARGDITFLGVRAAQAVIADVVIAGRMEIWIQLANDPDDLGPPEIELSCLEAGWIPEELNAFSVSGSRRCSRLWRGNIKFIKEELEKNPPQDQTRAKHLRAANQCLTDCSTRLDAVADGGVFGSGLPQEQCDLNHPKALLYSLSGSFLSMRISPKEDVPSGGRVVELRRRSQEIASPTQIAPEIGRERLDADAHHVTERVRESLPDAHPVQDPEHRRVPVPADQEVERVERRAVGDSGFRPRELAPSRSRFRSGASPATVTATPGRPLRPLAGSQRRHSLPEPERNPSWISSGAPPPAGTSGCASARASAAP